MQPVGGGGDGECHRQVSMWQIYGSFRAASELTMTDGECSFYDLLKYYCQYPGSQIVLQIHLPCSGDDRCVLANV